MLLAVDLESGAVAGERRLAQPGDGRLLALAHLEAVGHPLQIADVGEGDHHPFDRVVRGAVGENAAHEGGAVVVIEQRDLARLQLGRHVSRVVEKRGIVHSGRQVADRPADIAVDHT